MLVCEEIRNHQGLTPVWLDKPMIVQSVSNLLMNTMTILLVEEKQW